MVATIGYDWLPPFWIILALSCTDGAALLQNFLSGAIHNEVTGKDEATTMMTVDLGERYRLLNFFSTDLPHYNDQSLLQVRVCGHFFIPFVHRISDLASGVS